MLNLIFNYLIIFILVLGITIGFFVSKSAFNNKKSIGIFLITSFLLFLVLFFSKNLFNLFNFLEDYMYILFFTVAIILFIMDLAFIKLNNDDKLVSDSKNVIFIVLTIFIILIVSFMMASQYEMLSIFDIVLSVVFLFIASFVAFQLSKLLQYAKRPFHLIISEYVILEIILIVILGLTYTSTKNLDWTMFSSYLILTPTYLVLYTIIAIIGILLIGVYLNDRMLKKEE